VSVTVRLDPAVRAVIVSISEDAWTTIKYPNAIFDEGTGTWVSKAQAEVPYAAFSSRKKAERVTGRLVVRRIPDVHASRKQAAGQGTLFDLWRFPRVLNLDPPTGFGCRRDLDSGLSIVSGRG